MTSFQRILSQIVPSRICFIIFNAFITVFVISHFDSYYNNFYTAFQFALYLPTGGRTLQIIRAKVSDGGEYTCIAINQAGESKKKVSLTVYGLFILFS